MALTDSIEHKLDRGLSEIRRTGRRVGRTTRSAAHDLHADVTDDLRGLVDRVIRELGARLAGRPVTNRIMPDVIVEADADLLGLALRQLVDNAAKYSSPGSAIDVDASMASSVDLVVRNLGPAIPEHERDRIFERFVRGAQASRLPGSGMGLAIVRRIAQAHGGDVTAASSDGVTEFRLSLPRAEVPR